MHCTSFFGIIQFLCQRGILYAYFYFLCMHTVDERYDIERHYELLKTKKRSVGERAADKMTEFLGSWKFIISFGVFLIAWIVLNVLVVWLRWDEYPFILLNLALSCLAAMQAPIIMMSQNRQNNRDRVQAKYDLAINRKAEREIEELQAEIKKIHKKLDRLLDRA